MAVRVAKEEKAVAAESVDRAVVAGRRVLGIPSAMRETAAQVGKGAKEAGVQQVGKVGMVAKGPREVTA